MQSILWHGVTNEFICKKICYMHTDFPSSKRSMGVHFIRLKYVDFSSNNSAPHEEADSVFIVWEQIWGSAIYQALDR